MKLEFTYRYLKKNRGCYTIEDFKKLKFSLFKKTSIEEIENKIRQDKHILDYFWFFTVHCDLNFRQSAKVYLDSFFSGMKIKFTDIDKELDELRKEIDALICNPDDEGICSNISALVRRVEDYNANWILLEMEIFAREYIMFVTTEKALHRWCYDSIHDIYYSLSQNDRIKYKEKGFNFNIEELKTLS